MLYAPEPAVPGRRGRDRQAGPQGDRARGRARGPAASCALPGSWPRPASRSTSATSAGAPNAKDPTFLNFLFDGRTIGEPGFGNFSYFDSPKYNTAARAGVAPDRRRALPGPTASWTSSSPETPPRRSLSRSSTPSAFVSKRTGCVIMNPEPRPDGGLPEVTARRSRPSLLLGYRSSRPRQEAADHAPGGGTLRMAIPAENFDSIDAAITGTAGTTTGRSGDVRESHGPARQAASCRDDAVVPDAGQRAIRESRAAARRTPSPSGRMRDSRRALPVTAARRRDTRSTAPSSPSARSRTSRRFSPDIVGAQAVLAGQGQGGVRCRRARQHA